nr:hypothetical protein [Campylobacter sp.]
MSEMSEKDFQILFLKDLVKNQDKFEMDFPHLQNEIQKISKMFKNICSQMNLNFDDENDFNKALNSLYEVYIEKKTNVLNGFETEEQCADFYSKNFDGEVLNANNGYKDYVNDFLSIQTQDLFSKSHNYIDFIKTYYGDYKQDEITDMLYDEICDSSKEKDEVIDVLQDLDSNYADEFNELDVRLNRFDFSNGSDLVVSPNDMFEWIQDKDSIVFPFDEKDTIDNKDFAFAFAQECMSPKTKLSDLKEMLHLLKAKNMQLSKMLDEAKNHKLDVVKEINEEFKKSQNIKSDFSEIYKNNFDVNLDESIYEKVKKQARYDEYQKARDNDEKVYKDTKWSKK